MSSSLSLSLYILFPFSFLFPLPISLFPFFPRLYTHLFPSFYSQNLHSGLGPTEIESSAFWCGRVVRTYLMSWGKNQRKLNSILISLLQNLVRYVFLIPRSLRLWLVSLVSREMSDYSGVFQRPIFFTNKHKYKCILLTYLLTYPAYKILKISVKRPMLSPEN